MDTERTPRIPTPKILIVDDRRENLIAMEALLQDQAADLHCAECGNDALALMLRHNFALVLLDVQMPGMDGFEVAELMRTNPATRSVPIIFVTAISKEEHYRFKGYEVGAVDYLYKPIDPFILRSKVRVFLELWSQCQRLQLAMEQLSEANRKITEQQRLLHELAIHDHLTGLYQRRWFDELIVKTLEASRRSGEPLALAMLDIDHFKQVNDAHGHPAGDRVLRRIAELLQGELRASDDLFRYGGEEFAILFPHTTPDQAAGICERIRQRIAEQTGDDAEQPIPVTISAGLVGSRGNGDRVEDLVLRADQLLYRAKDAGRNRICWQDAQERIQFTPTPEAYP